MRYLKIFTQQAKRDAAASDSLVILDLLGQVSQFHHLPLQEGARQQNEQEHGIAVEKQPD